MRLPIFLLLAFVASSLGCLKQGTKDEYVKKLREYCSISTILTKCELLAYFILEYKSREMDRRCLRLPPTFRNALCSYREQNRNFRNSEKQWPRFVDPNLII